MAILQEYYRPGNVDEALALLTASGGRLLPLAGGTTLIGQLETRALPHVEGVVDLRDAGLGTIGEAGGAIHIGAMCTLFNLTEHSLLRDMANGLLVRAARGEGPVNLRYAATIGGVVACAEYDSELYTALLALGATVTARRLDGDEVTVPLSQFASTGALITGVQIPARACRGGAARIARTSSDRPIVAAYAVRDGDGAQRVRVALCGVASRPVLAGAAFEPPDDYKGSARYRLAMAETVTRRSLAELEETVTDAG